MNDQSLRAGAALLLGYLLLAVTLFVPSKLEAGTSLKATVKAIANELPDAAGSEIHPVMDDAGLARALARSRPNGRVLAPPPAPRDPAPLDGIALPVGQQTFKIEVAADGIYALSYDALSAAGMDVDAVDPGTFQMVYRGSPVAIALVGDADNAFEPGEAVRFYGEAFKGPRLERQYVDHNVYWLWAGGTPTPIGAVGNPTGYPVDDAWLSSITYELDAYYFGTWTNQWHTFPNEPDAWFIERLAKSTQTLITGTYAITLPTPAASGSATVTVEVNSRPHPVVDGISYPHVVRSHVNSGPITGSYAWFGTQNVNVVGTVANTDLVDGANQIDVVVAGTTGSGSSATSYIFVNRATVDYPRHYVALGDELLFRDEVGGNRQYDVSGFTEGDEANILVWNVTDPFNPAQVDMAGAVDGAGPYTYRVGSSGEPGVTFIATTVANLREPAAITAYTPIDLNPPSGADWVAISHADFMTATLVLEAHRQDPQFGGYSTHVVDVADVLNQLAYGLPIPGGIRDYLAQSLAWPVPPHYVLLVGDGTINPKQLDAQDPDYEGHPDFVPADLIFVDRFQGQIPSDTNLVLLTGNDYIPDMAIGRIAATIPAHADRIVAKIIRFEQNLLAPQPWMDHFAFFADNPDSGGDFCAENAATAALLPASLEQSQSCMLDNSEPERTALKNAFFQTGNDGALMLNYRGHGGIDHWIKGPALITTADAPLWTNTDKPFVILSADCLDSHFTWPGLPSLAETFLKLDNAGSAAHWSSTGLGFSYEHDVLHQNFLRGLFDEGGTTIGDAIQHAKVVYEAGPWHVSELLAFMLHGDPAMLLMRPDLALSKGVAGGPVSVGEPLTFTLSVTNTNDYPARVTITDSLPAQIGYTGFTASAPVTVTTSGNNVVFATHEPLGRDDSLAITLTASLISTSTEPITNSAVAVAAAGLDADPGDNGASVAVCTTTPAPPPSLSIDRSGTTLNLSWEAVPLAANGYQVWRSPPNQPYFSPGNDGSTLLATVTGTGYAVTTGGGVGDVVANYTFLVRSLNCAGAASAPSNRVGEFDYELVETASSDQNWIALPLGAAGIADAGDLALAVEAGSSGAVTVSSVSRWNPVAQGFTTFFHFGGGVGFGDFAVSAHNAYLIEITDVGIGNSVVWSTVGDVPAIGSYAFTLYETASTDINWVMLPLHLDSVTMAGQLALHIEANASAGVSVNSVQTWNALAQGYTTFFHFGGGAGFGDFSVRPGYPYLVEVDVTTGGTVTWP